MRVRWTGEPGVCEAQLREVGGEYDFADGVAASLIAQGRAVAVGAEPAAEAPKPSKRAAASSESPATSGQEA